jgi:23S rRNA pseudouridine2605 synthase
MIRIAKFLADKGIASRREAEKIIEAGRVSINGAVINTPVSFVEEGDDVRLDGKLITCASKVRVIAFHKPINTMTTARDPSGRKTIYDCLPSEFKNFKYIGRLDFKTDGLLLLTNSGELARKLTLPESGVRREYIAKLRPKGFAEIKSPSERRALKEFLSPLSADDNIFNPLRKGVTINGMRYAPMEVELKSRYPIQARIVLVEGKKNEIRIAFDHIGLPVSKLRRVSYAGIELGDMKPGEIKEIYDLRFQI